MCVACRNHPPVPCCIAALFYAACSHAEDLYALAEELRSFRGSSMQEVEAFVAQVGSDEHTKCNRKCREVAVLCEKKAQIKRESFDA